MPTPDLDQEKTLRRSEARIRAVLNALTEGVVFLNNEGVVEETNNAVERIVGYSQAALGDPASDPRSLIVRSDGTLFLVEEQPALVVLRTGKAVRNIEMGVPKPDGTLTWLLVNAEPVRDDQGNLLGVVSSIFDITERKRGEEALRESEEQFQALADSIPNLAWWANCDGYITWYNRRWYEYTGTTHEQMEGWGWQSVHDPNELPKVLELWQTSIATGEPFDMTFPLRGADGVFRLFLTRVVPLKDASGHVKQWFGTHTDISELKRVEEARRTSEERLAAMLENLSEGLIMADDHGQVIYWNPAALAMFGYASLNDCRRKLAEFADTFEVRPLNENRPIPVEDWPMSRVLRGEVLHDWEVRLRRMDQGWEKILAYSGWLIRSASGERLVFISTTDITDRKRNQEALEKSQRLLAETEKIGKVGGWEFDIDTGKQTWTEEIYKIHEVELTYEPIMDNGVNFYTPASRPIIERAVRDAIERGEPYDLELEITTTKGNLRSVHTIGKTDLEHRRIYGFFQDITERKQAEEAMRESELNYRGLFDNKIVGITRCQAVLDEKGQPVDYRFLSVNDTFEKITGLKKDMVLGHIAREVMPGIENSAFDFIGVHTMVALNGGGTTFEQYQEYLKRWYSVFVYSPKKDFFVSIFSDITDRKLAEDALRRREAEARARAEELAILMDTVPALIFIAHDPECRRMSCSKKTYQFMHVPEWGNVSMSAPEEERPTSYRVMKDGNELTPDQLPMQIATTGREVHDFELTFIFNDGTSRDLLGDAVPLFDDSGKVRGSVGIFLDITEHKRLEMERLQSMKELGMQEQLLIKQGRFAAMGEMIGNIAHQWRQPLNTLGLIIQEMPVYFKLGKLDQQYLDESAKKAMQTICNMSQTIDDFRDFLKPDKERVLFRASEAVQKAVSLVEASFKVTGLQLQTVVDEEVSIEGFPNEYSQVILNILTNAKDALLEQKTVNPLIVLRLFGEHGKAVLTVTDNAGGIPDAIIDKIFDPYFTTKGPDKGTGIGLFMSKAIIEKNIGGRLSVRNIVGGAEFRIEV